MNIALSTRWNAGRHRSGEAMIQEIRATGIDSVELGYDLRIDLVPGVRKMVDEKAVKVVSVHNFCPVPMGVPFGHPEIFQLSSLDRRNRESAITGTVNTIHFAAGVGAQFVVAHAGSVEMKNRTLELIDLAQDGKQYEARYEKVKMKLLIRRDEKAAPHIERLIESLEHILPTLKETNVRLGLENLPFWESIPTEAEMEAICGRFDTPMICYWHDIGHGQIRQNLAFIGLRLWLERLKGRLGGMHIHDVDFPARDHLMPPRGRVDFASFKSYAESGIALVLEPAPGTPVEDIREGLRIIREAWASSAPEGGT